MRRLTTGDAYQMDCSKNPDCLFWSPMNGCQSKNECAEPEPVFEEPTFTPQPPGPLEKHFNAVRSEPLPLLCPTNPECPYWGEARGCFYSWGCKEGGKQIRASGFLSSTGYTDDEWNDMLRKYDEYVRLTKRAPIVSDIKDFPDRYVVWNLQAWARQQLRLIRQGKLSADRELALRKLPYFAEKGLQASIKKYFLEHSD